MFDFHDAVAALSASAACAHHWPAGTLAVNLCDVARECPSRWFLDRSSESQQQESDDVGRSLTADRRRRAKTKTTKGRETEETEETA
jgi:hypothetical protein